MRALSSCSSIARGGRLQRAARVLGQTSASAIRPVMSSQQDPSWFISGPTPLSITAATARCKHTASSKQNKTNNSHPTVKCLPHMSTWTCTFVVSDPQTQRCVIIDSAVDYTASTGSYQHIHADSVIAYVKEQGLMVDYILETHAHADHLSAAPYLKEKLGGKIAIGKHIDQVQKAFEPLFHLKPPAKADSFFDVLLEDDAVLSVGELRVQVLHTPGHTPACLSYLIGDAVFTGDTLFHPDIGTARCDFPGGSSEQLWDSCQKLLSLPPDTRCFMGHDYPPPTRPFQWEISIGEQKASNKMVKQGTTKEQFLTMRNGRDKTLAAPVLILPSIQVNIHGGFLPPPESNGITYLKIPINKLGGGKK